MDDNKVKEKKEEEGSSKKKLVLRIIGFAVALTVAVAAFTYGVVMIGHKDAGYNTVEADLVDSTLVNHGNLKFEYYFTGSSSEIKRALNGLRNRYGVALNRAFKMLDSETEYDGFNNIATVNVNNGAAVTVNQELYNVLFDAYTKTKENKGYNMFAGALYKEWNSILILEDPLEYDPLFNEAEAKRLQKIAETVNDLDNFELVFNSEAKSVKLSVSGNYKAFVSEYELTDAPIIDLNLLYDAYELTLIADVLNGEGYTNGYFTTASGLSLSLDEHDNEAVYDFLYLDENGTLSSAANAKMTKCSVMSRFCVLPYKENEYYYYTAVKDGKTYNRNPYYTADGEFSGIIKSSYAISDKRSAADVCYANIVLFAAKTPEDAAKAIESFTDISAAYILQNDDKPTFYTNKAAEGVIVVNPALAK